MIEIFEAGEVRRLGLVEQSEESLRCAWPLMAGPDGSPDPIPRDQWQETDLSALVDRIHNQNGVGMCASAGTAGTLEIARNQAGLPFVALSAGDLYRRVCGGRDQGSLPEENLTELLTNGIAPESVCPYLDWRKDHATPEQRLKGFEAWRLPTVDHLATAVQMGFACEIGYWHSQTDNPGPDGWMLKPNGRKGGHAVRVVGLVKGHGDWGFKFPNSWTTTWGVNGYGILPLSRVAEGIKSFQSWALRCSVREGGNLPPLKV